MAETLSQTETGSWELFGPIGAPLETLAAAWSRVESFVAFRWGERNVVWVVEGPGEWVPPLRPATIESIDVWSSAGAWEEAVGLSASPLGGYWLPATGPYRFSGTVGDPGVPPGDVQLAVKRLAIYLAELPTGDPGVISESIQVGNLRMESRRDPAAVARALQMSGAADLLRPYRRA